MCCHALLEWAGGVTSLVIYCVRGRKPAVGAGQAQQHCRQLRCIGVLFCRMQTGFLGSYAMFAGLHSSLEVQLGVQCLCVYLC
jgi:hypothetical protein